MKKFLKEFLVGILFLAAFAVLAGLGFFLFPFIIVLSIAARLLLGLALVIGAIWLLGKCVVLLWERIR